MPTPGSHGVERQDVMKFSTAFAGYIHLGAEVLGRVRWGILEDLLQFIHIPKRQKQSSRKKEGINHLLIT